MAGRPSLLTDELRETIERRLADGVPVYVVAASAGVSKRTLHEWLADGRVVRRSRLHVVPDEPAAPPSDDVNVERALVSAIMRGAQTDWRAAAWLLEHKYERWRKP